MAKDYYKLADLIQAIHAYEPPQRQAPLKTSLHARVRIGGSASFLADRLKDKSATGKRYTLDTLAKAMRKEADPYRRLLFHNVMLRVDFSYGRFLQAANALTHAGLNLAERHASWYSLYVHRFTRMQAFSRAQWAKSGFLLRKQYNTLAAQARYQYRDLETSVQDALHPGHTHSHYVIAMSEFLDETHPLTKQALDLAAALSRNAGANVSILNTSIPPRLPISYFGDHTTAHVIEPYSSMSTLDYGTQSFGFAQNPNLLANARSFQWYAQQISALNPTGVITIGPGNMIADTFARCLPTMAFPNIGEVPLSAAPIKASVSDMSSADSRLTQLAGTDPQSVHQIPTAFRLPASAGPLARSTFKHPVGAKIALIVGMRLETECSPEFLSLLDNAAAEHDALHFVFAGPVMKPQTWLKAYKALSAKSDLMGYQTDVLSVSQTCDIYINPFRQGGGTSAIYAMSAGLPIVSLDTGDVADIFDAGACAESPADFANLLDSVITQEQTFKRLAAQARKRWAVKSDMTMMTNAIVSLFEGEDVVHETEAPAEFALETIHRF